MENQPVHPEGNQSWTFTGRTDAEAEIPIIWPPDSKDWLIGKDPDAGQDWRQKEKGMTVHEMVGWHHQLNGHEFEQTPGFGDGQGRLVCCSPWGHKESDTIEWLNWTDLDSTNFYTFNLAFIKIQSTNFHLKAEFRRLFLFAPYFTYFYKKRLWDPQSWVEPRNSSLSLFGPK